ncbi:unnamed protein product [Triticum turgidum subsp. durum]|uniref:Uncharacterized protein n=1 Tax=Triticum turgidum subsp. durum TaxID=4567 RepID=A0A9R0TRN8_TRITD|nr:unnamed protein product [Triticum turgidum subsp. durum]
MEADIQCFILKRASEAWQPQTEGQGALQEAQKTLSEDHKQLEVKLRHTENRARTLEDLVEKLESQCKELSNASEILLVTITLLYLFTNLVAGSLFAVSWKC